MVNINDLRRVEIVTIATNLLITKVRRSRLPLTETNKRKLALSLEELVPVCKRELEFTTITNSRVKGVNGSNEDHETDNIGQFYIDAIPDILLQEGWKMYSSTDSFVPEVNNHPFWGLV